MWFLRKISLTVILRRLPPGWRIHFAYVCMVLYISFQNEKQQRKFRTRFILISSSAFIWHSVLLVLFLVTLISHRYISVKRFRKFYTSLLIDVRLFGASFGHIAYANTHVFRIEVGIITINRVYCPDDCFSSDQSCFRPSSSMFHRFASLCFKLSCSVRLSVLIKGSLQYVGVCTPKGTRHTCMICTWVNR